MERVRKIVGRISDKSGRAKTLSFGFLCFVGLILVFSVYGVFGSGEGSESSGYFRDSDKLGGWEYVDGGKVYTAYSVTEDLGGGKKAATIFSAPEYVKEDDILKNKREAKSLNGYYEIVRLLDDPEYVLEYVDWNWTNVDFRVKVTNQDLVNENIPIKKNGVQVSSIRLSNVNVLSPVISLEHEWGNWSFGFSSTTDTIRAVDNNASFRDATLTTVSPDFHGGSAIEINIDPPYRGVVGFNLSEFIGTGSLVTGLVWEFYVKNTYANSPYHIYAFNDFDCANWTEVSVESNGYNASWRSPSGNNSWHNFNDGTDTWTTGITIGTTFKSNIVYGEYYSGEFPNAGNWYNITFTNSYAQQQYENLQGVIGFGIVCDGTVAEPDYCGILGSVEDANDWYFHVEYIMDTPPHIVGDSVTISPPGTANDDFDLSCTFTPEDNFSTSLTAYVDWYNNTGTGGVVAVQNEMTVTNGTSSSFVLHNGNTTVGEYWNCSVRLYDGKYYSDWSNSTETEITGAPANKTDFTSPSIQSNNLKDVFVYDASKESWNRSRDNSVSWWYESGDFPDEVYLFLTDQGLDVMYTNGSRWMDFIEGNNNAIDGNDFTSVYALDGKVYVGSELGLYVLDFANDNISRYDNSNGLAYYNHQNPFTERNNGAGYIVHDATKKLASDVVNDINANRVRGEHFVAVATDGSATGAVNIINMDDGTIAELDFCEDPNNYDSENIFIADDGTLYFSENEVSKTAGKTKLSYKYNIDTYTDTDGRAEGYDASASAKARCDKVGYRSSDFAVRSTSYPYFLSEKINDIYVTSYTSRRHTNHNTIYIGTEKGISVIQEFQGDEGIGVSKSYSYTGSSENVNYKVLEGGTDNVTAVTARSDGNAMYVGTNNGAGLGSVSKISLNSNTLVDSWNTTTDTTIVGNDTTSLDFLDGDLLIGTLDSGATQIVEQELDHYLITEHDKHRIIEIDSTGLIHFEFGVYNTVGSDSTHLSNPTDAVRLTNGNTLIADYGNTRILEVDPDGSIVQEIGNSTQLSDATYLDGVYSVKKV